jgi:hypothetical protein
MADYADLTRTGAPRGPRRLGQVAGLGPGRGSAVARVVLSC